MTHFLLVYDRAAGRLRDEQRFDSRVDALRARFAAEKTHDAQDIEVVVLRAGSREDLLRTHARYFLTIEELAERIA